MTIIIIFLVVFFLVPIIYMLFINLKNVVSKSIISQNKQKILLESMLIYKTKSLHIISGTTLNKLKHKNADKQQHLLFASTICKNHPSLSIIGKLNYVFCYIFSGSRTSFGSYSFHLNTTAQVECQVIKVSVLLRAPCGVCYMFQSSKDLEREKCQYAPNYSQSYIILIFFLGQL